MVEHHLAKVDVESSNLFARSKAVRDPNDSDLGLSAVEIVATRREGSVLFFQQDLAGLGSALDQSFRTTVRTSPILVIFPTFRKNQTGNDEQVGSDFRLRGAGHSRIFEGKLALGAYPIGEVEGILLISAPHLHPVWIFCFFSMRGVNNKGVFGVSSQTERFVEGNNRIVDFAIDLDPPLIR